MRIGGFLPTQASSLVRRWLRTNHALPWGILFLFLSLFVTQDGGTNAAARITGLRAITESHSLMIDNYPGWTNDWSKAPSGHYYPNKAPGGVLFGLPIFALVDLPVLWWLPHSKDPRGMAPPPGYPQHLVLILFMQLLPFTFLVLFLAEFLMNRLVDPMAIHFFAICALFGNTAAIYMNSYYGHGLAAIFFLACFYFWLIRNYGWSSFFLACCLLTDYGAACTIPFFAISILFRERSMKPFGAAVLGAFPIALLWIWYHWTVFGSPFAVASQFINSGMLVKMDESDKFWASDSILPSPFILFRLLFGPERGMLFFVPWALAIFPLAFLPPKNIPGEGGTKIFLVGAQLGLLWLNSSVGGWDGGLTVGPRYICLIFPTIAFALALSWREFPRLMQLLLIVAMIVSFAFRIWIYPFRDLAPAEPLWSYYFLLYNLVGLNSIGGFRLAVAVTATAFTLLWVWWRYKRFFQGSKPPISSPLQGDKK